MQHAQLVSVLCAAIISASAKAQPPSSSLSCAAAVKSHCSWCSAQSVQQTSARLLSVDYQKTAKKIVDALAAKPELRADISQEVWTATQVTQFTYALHEKHKDTVSFEHWNWALIPQEVLLACFPDLMAFTLTFDARVRAAKQREEEAASRQADLGRIPKVVLGTAYLAYADVKRCYEARESYAVGYLAYEEMELARNTVRQIEDAMRPKLDPGTTTDDIWSAYMKNDDRHFSPSRDFVERDRRRCRERFNWLLKILRQNVPESYRIEKDF